MIKYFWFDHIVANRNDITEPSLDGLNEIKQLFNAEKISAVPSEPKENRFYFVHPGDRQTAWESFAVNPNNVNVHILFVSRSPWSPSQNSDVTPKYYITQPLPTIAKFLSEHSDKIESFKKSCEEGNPDWSVFEPVVYPDALVAYYLAIVANEQKMCITLSEELKKEAEEHYKQLKAKHGCGEAFDREGIKALFTKMATT